MKHTWGPEHRSKWGRRINVCARCGLVREKLWSYTDDGVRVAYRHEDGTLAGIRAPVCEATEERKLIMHRHFTVTRVRGDASRSVVLRFTDRHTSHPITLREITARLPADWDIVSGDTIEFKEVA